ncbi:YbaN family protein [Sphingomonas sp. 8AM]|uniref:YbaN family protein n=1 Tax=Sphingomonas sp. 8AM TaxID=2653170 RepID=UPI0012F1FFD7|nr:YbaN family protein [Sphingomonas sp. 8AM]VXC57695.1 Membrane protein [Sphingomonas sp. 8AM]
MTDRPADPIKPGRLHAAVRYGWLALGFLLVALGVIGALLPLMPTTIFLILAAGCFARSSPRLEAWLLDHPRFGPTLRAWRRNRAIPRRAKLLACTGIATGYALFLATAHPRLPLALVVAAAMAACALFILSRPTAAPSSAAPWSDA